MSPPRRIAVSSPHMATQGFAELLPRVASHFSVWELWAEGRHSLEGLEPAIRELLPSYDVALTVHAPVSDINIGSFRDDMRDLSVRAVERTILSAGRLGLDRVTVHPGVRMPLSRFDEGRIRARTLEAVDVFSRMAADVGVTVCLENMARNFVFTFQEPEWAEGVFGHDDNLAFCLDLGHAWTHGRGVFDRFLSTLAPRAANVHVSDNAGDLDSHWPLGKGSVPLRDAVARLERSGYRGNYVIEAANLDEGITSLPAMVGALDAAAG